MSKTGRIGGGRVCGEEGFCGRCNAQGVQDCGGGRDRLWWCGSGGMRKSRVGGMCAAQRRRVLKGCGGCSGRRLRACVGGRCTFKAGCLAEPSEIQVSQLFAYLACARLRRRSGCQRYSATEREGDNVRWMKGGAVREELLVGRCKGAAVVVKLDKSATGAKTRAVRAEGLASHLASSRELCLHL